MKCGSFDGGDCGEHASFDFWETSFIFVAQDDFLFGTEPFDTGFLICSSCLFFN